jgi:hypothetical protein
MWSSGGSVVVIVVGWKLDDITGKGEGLIVVELGAGQSCEALARDHDCPIV